MKKLRILVILIILAFSFSVKALAFVEMDCNGKEIINDKNVTCEVRLVHEEVSISDIDISYQTNLDVKFTPLNGFTMTNSNGRLSLHTNTPLYEEIMDSVIIMKFTLSSNDKSSEVEKISLTNIKIDKSDIEEIDDVEESFNVSLSKEEVKLDNICTLNSITIEKEKLKNFDKDKLEYRGINVQKEVIFIDAVRTSDKSSATGLGDVRVSKGETIERDIVVTAEDGSRNVYKLFITNTTPKQTSTPTATATSSPTVKVEVTKIIESTNTPEPLADKKEEKSNDNTLKKLELYNGKKKIDFKFDSSKTNYDIKLDEEITKVTIKATLNDEKATFTNLFGPRDVTLDLEDNDIRVKVKAENGEERIYKITIHIPKKSSDNTLSSLKINDIVVNLDTDNLEIKLPNEIEKTKIEAVAKNNKATIKYDDISLEVGDNLLKITVTAENGTSKEYNINVIREKEIVVTEDSTIKSDTKLNTELPKADDNSNTIYYIIGISILVILIGSVYIIKRKKLNKPKIEEI